MAKKTIQTNNYGEAPVTLNGHPFYGLDCSDEEQEFQDWRKVCKETAKHIINE